MFRFEMSRAGSVTERVKQRERWRGEKQNQEGWFTKVDERHFLISRLLEDTGQDILQLPRKKMKKVKTGSDRRPEQRKSSTT